MLDARILVVDDEPSMRDVLRILLTREGYRVHTAASAEEALLAFEADPHDLVLTDLNLPATTGLELLRSVKMRAADGDRDVPVIMITAYGTAESAVEAMKTGAFDYVMKPFNNDELLLIVRRALEAQRLKAENVRLKAELADRYNFGTLIGSCTKMQGVYRLIQQVKDSRISCFIRGESGTGKELVARAIHYNGTRSGGPFVAINCGAIPEGLIESELFGYRKGAFTGALRDKEGLFAAAHNGTIFLDEVGDMPGHTQVKVLRAIQERRITPVGGVEEREVDVRILSASNRDLDLEVAEGRFREDLYYRLHVVSIDLPPLREREDDVLELARAFLERYALEYGKPLTGLTPDAARALKGYRFPGNVRELQNVIERAVALSSDTRIGSEVLPGHLEQVAVPTPAQNVGFPPNGVDLDGLVDEFERAWLTRALEATRGPGAPRGNKTEAAKLLGLSTRSFRYRLQKLGLDDDLTPLQAIKRSLG